MKAEIDLMENGKVYVVKDGELFSYQVPAFGFIHVISHGGKIKEVEKSEKERF